MVRHKKVTMLDVAHEANVSYQTVSRVINQHPNVAPETRQRVLDVIKQLNYRPNKVARSLATSQSKTLAVITYDMRHYGPTQMVANIEQSARQHDYDLILSNISDDDDLTPTIENIDRRATDGLLLIAPVKSNRYELLVKQFRYLPMVHIDITRGAKVPSVVIDQRQGSYDITRYLLELGHVKIAEISGPMDWYGAIARHEGFLQALDEVQLLPVAVTEGDWTPRSGYDCANQLLDQYDFTALVVGNDQMALGTMHAILKRKLCVPDDISIVGFDDIPESAYFTPPLTTVFQDFSQLGKVGVETLIAMINEPDYVTTQKLIKTRLVIRESATSPRK